MQPSATRHGSTGRLVLTILTIATAWGVTYSLYKVGLEHTGPLWLAAMRFEAFAAAIFVAALFVPGALATPRTRGDFLAVGTYAVLNVILHNVFTISGAGHVPVAVIGILAGTTPVLTVAFARLVPPYLRLNPAILLGLASGFAGVSLLALQRDAGGRLDVSLWALVVLAGFTCWAFGTVVIRASGSTLHGLSLGLWGALAGVLVLQPLALATEPVPAFDWTLVGVVAFTGVVGGVVGFLLWLSLVRGYGARQANLVSFVSPIATTLAGVLLLQETIQPLAYAAYALVALGLVLAVQGMPREPTQAPPATAATPADA